MSGLAAKVEGGGGESVRCRTVRYPGGGVIVCGPKRGQHVTDGRCSHCDKDAVATCDFPIGRGVCGMPICGEHQTERGGADLCPAHAKPLKL